MVRPPSPEDEDHRRLSREREALVKERIQHTNRIKLAAQGITDFEPLRPGHRARLDGLTTGDGRALPPRLKEEIRRQLARLDAVISGLPREQQSGLPRPGLPLLPRVPQPPLLPGLLLPPLLLPVQPSS